MKISTRLSLGFGAAMALGLAIALTGTFSLRAVATDVQEAEVSMAAVDLLRDFKDHLHASARSASHLLILRDPALRQAEQQQLAELRQHNRALLAQLEPLAAQAQTPALRTAIADARPRYDQALDAAIALGEQGQAEQAGSLLLGEVRTHQDTLFKAIDEATDAQAALAAKRAQAAEGFARARAMLMLGLAAGMVVLGGLVAWRLARSLARALGAEPAELSAALQRVADGDLAARVRVRAGDTRSTMANVARMQQTLATIVATVRGNSDSVATASAQIAQGNQDLSSRTEQQASALQQTAASMEQLGAAVRHNADHARQAKQLALSASAIAGQGGQVVAEVVTTMRDIHTSSRRIVDIISVIDGIAFQTNILALNAAVEAARAGEQGRGFAVVASEVRQLAQRSAEAAREIKQLITASVERVEQGATLVDGAGATMSEVVGAIQRVTDIVAEISAASQEQSTGVTQVGEAVVQMDHATQRNAALVEESAAAAESLRSQAQALVQAVAVFRLQATAAAAPAARKAGAQGDWRAC